MGGETRMSTEREALAELKARIRALAAEKDIRERQEVQRRSDEQIRALAKERDRLREERQRS